MKYKIIVIIIFIISPFYIKAQQLPRYTQYVFTEFLLNPSIAGYDGRTNLNFIGRKEWIGFAGNTPQTYSFSAQTRILKSKLSVKSGPFGKFKGGSKGRVGLGLNIFADNNGAINQSGIEFVYAYHLFVENTQVSMGLGGTIKQYKINKDKAVLKDPSDNLNSLLGKPAVIPDVSFGISVMNVKYHLGLSVSQLFESKVKFGSTELALFDSVKLKRHYFLLFSCRNLMNSNWEYEPSFIFRTDEKLRTLTDISIKFLYDRTYWFGFSGRTSGELSLLLGCRYDRYYFGYSFDYGFNKLSRLSWGSHEIILSAKLGDSTRRYKWFERY